MTLGKPTGNQIAFFIVASGLVILPIVHATERVLDAGPDLRSWLESYLPFLIVGAAFIAIGPLRRACSSALKPGIPSASRAEITIVATLMPILGFGFAGAYALWWATYDGPAGLQQRIAALGAADQTLKESLQWPRIATQALVGALIGPIVEELVFRAFLFRAWAERYGWVVAMSMSSAAFALLHPFFIAAFLDSLLYTCVYRRTGSLRAAILLHGLHNVLIYYPLLGQFMLPLDLDYPGDLASWSWHLVALAVEIVLLPIYIWVSRDPAPMDEEIEMDHVALPR